MDFGSTQVYEVELWAPNGARIADISKLCNKKRVTLQRNEAEQFTFDMDLSKFEAYLSAQGITNGRSLLEPYWTEVRVKRAGSYWVGLQVVDISISITNSGSTGDTVSVWCTGYLNLMKDRYVTVNYTATDACVIAEGLITTAQGVTNGSVGMTINGTNYRTGVNRDRTYVRQNVKQGLQNLTQLVDGRFDFAFGPDKTFYTYSQLGAKRTDFAIVVGGYGSNVTEMQLDRTATNLYNQVIGLGSGFGADQLVSTQDDTTSQRNYYLRQDIRQYNSVILQPTLDDNAKADLMLEKDVLEIPRITITGRELQNIPILSVGDRVNVTAPGHPFLTSIDGWYRIEKMEVSIDENDFEEAITLYFDNYAVAANGS